jgi:hypothetical protein
MWEILTGGEIPYTGMSNQETIEEVTKGNHLPRPQQDCPDYLWELLLSTWTMEPHQRPSFKDIANTLKDATIEDTAIEIKDNTPPSVPQSYEHAYDLTKE